MLKGLKLRAMLAAIVGLGIHQSVMAAADKWQMNMYRGVTPLSKDMYDLHMIAMVICAIIGLVVFGVMIYSLIHHRKSKGYAPASFHDNSRLEIVWSVIPFLILIGLAIPATKVLIRLEDSSDSDVTIKVVGYQWKWQYQYLDQGISFFSNLSTPYEQIHNEKPKGQWYLLEVDNPVVVPVNKKIRFLVTSNDVIHSWWVPELGVKRDAMPGFMHEAWARIEKPGIYRGQCAELCGLNHAYMPIVVKAVSEDEFNNWVATQTKVRDQYAENAAQPAAQAQLTRDQLMMTGKQKYEQFCAACHRADGKGLPPLYPPLKGSSVAVGNPISRHINIILHGVPGTAMQAFKDQLTDEEIAAITTYERNAWGNNTNDSVQPADVAQVRQSNNQQPTMVNKAQAGGLR
ncbi:cytochrome c oxidase subunit II [Legionella jordanis]|uniref:Cytochrome c oxidase subunit 2 n=1 Tax=Legionella jordanis TaxID=456 RepID=A0A0W0VCJ0_9GAMM|nr:cytochrome c oxidase subunit II [Legionella jordanis]KTD17824.1 cytochrome c oxidase subunit II [Legionella jordanis]RMX02552.1 cytochrome c oxidase subunit II [Legionella jordanis]RMX21785.1 cytochrome c oxidase subunit II [Legionella jordanis]VEH11239.1 cytochrome c oxidase subunit II [Legionella jordanis]HAT8713793.1 cytochrome c oxidase subunit II [Legionella jordanis]